MKQRRRVRLRERQVGPRHAGPDGSPRAEFSIPHVGPVSVCPVADPGAHEQVQWIPQGRGQRRASNGQERLSQNKARSSTASLGLAKARPSATEAVSRGDKARCPRLGPRPAPATQGSMPQVHRRRTWVVKTRLWTVILGKTEEREPGKRGGEGRPGREMTKEI